MGTGQVTRAGELSGGGKRRSKMLLARVTGQLALLRYGAYWTISASYPGFGIGSRRLVTGQVTRAGELSGGESVVRRCCWRGSPGSLRCSAMVLIGRFWGRTRDSGFARWAYFRRRCCLDWWCASGGRSVGICGAVMRGVNTAYRKHPPRDDREKMMRYSGSVGGANLS